MFFVNILPLLVFPPVSPLWHQVQVSFRQSFAFLHVKTNIYAVIIMILINSLIIAFGEKKDDTVDVNVNI